MSSIRDGNVDVTNGSTTVTGNNTTWVDDGVSAGDLFVASGDILSYEIASVTSNTELELSGPYGGETTDSVNYSIHTSFTPNRKYPFPETGDFETATVVKKAIKLIDGDYAGFNPRGDYDSSTTYNKLDIVVASDGNSYIAETDGLTDDEPPSSNWTALATGITWRTGSGAPANTLGENGDFYIDTDTNDLYRKNSGSWSVITNLLGDTWFTGSGEPDSSTGENGDLYLDTNSGDVYEKSGGSWSVISNLQGAEWFTGSGSPSSSTGDDGDFYLDTDNGDIYQKSSGSWGTVANITGPQGPKGDEWHSGSGAPSSSLGDDGDFYLDTDNGDVYEKASGSWSVVDNLTGPTGPQGEKGDEWFTGSGSPSTSTGEDGDLYLDTDSGDIYENSSGSWSQISNIQGSEWLEDSGNPSDTNGNNGDFYLDTDSGDVYKKSGGSWSQVANIQGSEWLEGSGAPSSSLGNNGDFYLNNDDGDVYKKSSGSWSVITNIEGQAGDGAPTEIDLGDDGTIDSSDTTEIATVNDSNSIFTVPSTAKLLIDLSQNWPSSDNVDIGSKTSVTAASSDELLIEDASDAANPKKVTAQSIADLSVSGVDVEDGGTSVVSGATAINAGTDLSVTDDGDGTVTISSGFNIISASSPVTASVKDWIWADTSGGSFTITAPASPSVEDTFWVADSTGSFKDNPVTIDRNGENIMGLAENIDLDINNESYRFEYRGATQGWRVTT